MNEIQLKVGLLKEKLANKVDPKGFWDDSIARFLPVSQEVITQHGFILETAMLKAFTDPAILVFKIPTDFMNKEVDVVIYNQLTKKAVSFDLKRSGGQNGDQQRSFEAMAPEIKEITEAWLIHKGLEFNEVKSGYYRYYKDKSIRAEITDGDIKELTEDDYRSVMDAHTEKFKKELANG